MHTISKDFTFAAAHAIRGHTRGCQNLHGHNYRVRVHLRAAELDRLGMVLDFADLKAIVGEVLAPFDHRVINEIAPFDERNTTAEMLAAYVFEEVARRIPGDPGDAGDASEAGDRRLAVTRVEVWENETSCAVFEPDGPILADHR
ncbi:MAG TPA: 6-carboxytetrahydropterin synthase QueD [Thermoanaerobaculia bacterium]|nr:6-carboxytetrahydropterin synthase QueD [Thermoanaerobaculia bacterium]